MKNKQTSQSYFISLRITEKYGKEMLIFDKREIKCIIVRAINIRRIRNYS